jgi:hypothetical protein
MTQRFMAMMALTEPKAVSAAALIAAVRKLYPRYQASLTSLPGEPSVGAPLLIQTDGLTVTVLFLDQPMPADTMQSAIEIDKLWPEAAGKLKEHRAHAIVSHLEGAATQAEAILAAATVKVITAALSSLTPAIGIYWASGDTVTEAAAFRKATTNLVAGNLPVEVWAQMRWLDGPPTSKGERTLAVMTTGLLPFIGREIEFYPSTWSPFKISEYLISLTQYLLKNGLVIGDNESFGFTDDTQVGVRHLNHGQRTGIPILALIALN